MVELARPTRHLPQRTRCARHRQGSRDVLYHQDWTSKVKLLEAQAQASRPETYLSTSSAMSKQHSTRPAEARQTARYSPQQC